MAKDVGDSHNFPLEEENVMKFWKDIDAFKTSMEQSKDKPRYSFYDGPPFATGLPHYGHILAGSIKDIVTRYAHQSGFHVERRFGWDCHGLPVEYEIDQKLGIKGPEDVQKMGIAKYNEECRSIVMRYSKEWEFVVGRLGRWIDFENDYKTLYPTFMESVWWVFKQLHEKNMVYRGFRVMPYSTKCNTPLSNFESNQNYKDVTDPAVIVSFPLDEDPATSFIAWTTTPWTLPSNLALVVNADHPYVKVKDNSTEKMYIMHENRLMALFKKESDYSIMERFLGSHLVGKTYKPLFPYFESLKSTNSAFRVLADGYVTDDSGTGIVHSAPAFGEDDYRVCIENKILHRGGTLPCPVDASGLFTEEVSDFNGMYVKDADKPIIKKMKEMGRLVHQGNIKHSYPFCWRSDTPLIYKAVPSWFVRVEPMVQRLLDNNQKCYWVPEFVKEKRFHNWLMNARDWNVSRNRYWGTPIPLWASDDLEEVVCIGSIAELEELSGTKISDLHRESVDGITIPSQTGRGTLKRISEVFDCWFESGSMPYAQAHYPFENKTAFEESFPADFIAEGVDQTRGWFYTLLVISTALFDKPPFKNLIVNGLVLAKDGEKMSKRKKNYPDPIEIVNKYGADALRLYLINSPVVRAETLKFREEGVRDVIKDVLLPWYNAYRFLVQNIRVQEKEFNMKFSFDTSKVSGSSNIMDKWITSFAHSLLLFVKEEMQAYRLYTVVPRLMKFIDNLTNWYVRFNRKRLRGEYGVEDGTQALHTLFGVVFTMIRVMAPFTPFLTEHMYQNLQHFINDTTASDEDRRSVHFLMLPEPRRELIFEDVEVAVSRMQAVIELGRVARDRRTLPIKYPLPELVIVHSDEQFMKDVKSFEKYILEELNVKQLSCSSDKEKYGLHLRADLNHQVGRRLKQDFKKVLQASKELSDERLKILLDTGRIEIEGHEFTGEDIKVNYAFGENTDLSSTYEPNSDNEVVILLNVTPDQSMLDEGIAREIINRIQKLRKKAKLLPTEEITIAVEVLPAADAASVDPSRQVADVAQSHARFLYDGVKQPVVEASVMPRLSGLSTVIQEEVECKGAMLRLTILLGREKNAPTTAADSTCHLDAPSCRFVNLQLGDQRATLLLENPVGEYLLNVEQLKRQAEIIFNLQGKAFTISPSSTTMQELNADLTRYHGKNLFVTTRK